MLQLPISIRGIDRKSERRSCNVCIELEHYQRQNIFAWMVMVFPTIHINTNISVLLVDLYHVSIIQKILDKVNCLNMPINDEIRKHFISYKYHQMTYYWEFPNKWFRRSARMWNDQDRDVIHTVLKKCHIGDTFLLHLISKNTNTYVYKRIIKSIAVVLRESKVRSYWYNIKIYIIYVYFCGVKRYIAIFHFSRRWVTRFIRVLPWVEMGVQLVDLPGPLLVV